MIDVNQVWLKLLADLLHQGEVRPSRNGQTRELIANQTVIPMDAPVVTVAARKLGRKFLAAEAAWILAGDNRVSSIAPFSKEISRFSDDGLTFNGAYGPKFVDQVSYVVRCFLRDRDTRQAVMTTWRERPHDSADIPCTVALNWLIRDHKLHCVATMRSSDVWLGVPYDWHAFSMMSTYVLLSIRGTFPWLDLGNLYLTAGSQHLYDRNVEGANACLVDRTLGDPWPATPLTRLERPDDLVRELWRRAGGAV